MVAQCSMVASPCHIYHFLIKPAKLGEPKTLGYHGRGVSFLQAVVSVSQNHALVIFLFLAGFPRYS